MLNLMTIFGITALVFAAMIGLMAVGVLMGRREIKGSCGGLGGGGAAGEGSSCSLCSNPEAACRELGRGQTEPAGSSQVTGAVEDCDRQCEANGCSEAEIEACNRP